MSKIPVGVQLYSVRDDAEKDFLATLKKVKEIGYDFIELAGMYGHTASEIKKMLDEVGIKAISAHVPIDEFEKDMKKTVADYSVIGCKYVAIPYLVEERRPNTDGFDVTIQSIIEIAKACKESGITLLYHNHDFEFEKMPNGEFALDYLYNTISKDLLQTELDTCWVKVAGVDPEDYIRKYAGRCPIVHLKDFYKKGKNESMYELIGIDTEKKENEGVFELRPVGFGMQVVPDIVKSALESGAEYLVVEQDNSVGRAPMDAITMSRNYLKLMGI